MYNYWYGAQSYTANTCTLNEDGTITLSDITFEGEPPKTEENGAAWFADDTYESTWVLDRSDPYKHTCVPVNYDGEVGDTDVYTLPYSVYPNADTIYDD